MVVYNMMLQYHGAVQELGVAKPYKGNQVANCSNSEGDLAMIECIVHFQEEQVFSAKKLLQKAKFGFAI